MFTLMCPNRYTDAKNLKEYQNIEDLDSNVIFYKEILVMKNLVKGELVKYGKEITLMCELESNMIINSENNYPELWMHLFGTPDNHKNPLLSDIKNIEPNVSFKLPAFQLYKKAPIRINGRVFYKYHHNRPQLDRFLQYEDNYRKIFCENLSKSIYICKMLDIESSLFDFMDTLLNYPINKIRKLFSKYDTLDDFRIENIRSTQDFLLLLDKEINNPSFLDKIGLMLKKIIPCH